MSIISKFGYNRTQIQGTVHEDRSMFIVAGNLNSSQKSSLRVKRYKAIRRAEMVRTSYNMFLTQKQY